MEMEQTVSSETSAIRNQTPGNYTKRNTLHLEHGESLKTRSYEVRCLYGLFVYHILSCSSGSIFFVIVRSIYVCMFCMVLFNFVNHVFLLLCTFRSVYSVSLCCSVYYF